MLCLSACGGAPAAPPDHAAPRAAPKSFEEDARALLEEMAAVDSSHGHESDVVRPIAERLNAEGIRAEILESSPGRGNLIARIKGNGSKKPLLLLAHVDVVPVEGQPWTTKPFVPTVKDGFIYARGIADDKSMAAVFTAVISDLARNKTPLARDVILALTAGEETGGFAGVQWLLAKHRDRIDAEVALNEGAPTLTTNDFSAVQLVGIGVAEKTYQSYRLVAKGPGGHSSSPPRGVDPAATLGKALVKIGALDFPARVLPHVKTWLGAAAGWEKAPLSTALQRASETAPKLLPEDEALLSQDRTYNPLLRTTCVTTMLQASPQDNVLPTSAEAIVNCRIMPDETREATLAALIQAIGDPAVEVSASGDEGTGPPAPPEGEIPDLIAGVARRAFPSAKVVTTMSTGATDSRHLRGAGIVAYGLNCAPTSLDELRAGRGAHGPDERRPVKWLAPGAQFLREVVLAIAR